MILFIISLITSYIGGWIGSIINGTAGAINDGEILGLIFPYAIVLELIFKETYIKKRHEDSERL